MASIKGMMASSCTVIRDGAEMARQRARARRSPLPAALRLLLRCRRPMQRRQLTPLSTPRVAQKIDPALLVPGDVVRLCLGDRVPADMRIVYTADLKTECSSLTGEPDAIAATVVALHDSPLEARNIAFSSSLVMNGEGFGVVIRMIGSIATLASGSGQHATETLLEMEIHRCVASRCGRTARLPRWRRR